MKKKRKENAELSERCTYLESLQDRRMADLMSKNPEAIKRKFRNMQRRIRPKKFREQKFQTDILDQEIPDIGGPTQIRDTQFVGHSRQPTHGRVPSQTTHQRMPSSAFGYYIPQQAQYSAIQNNQMMFGASTTPQGNGYYYNQQNGQFDFMQDFGDI